MEENGKPRISNHYHPTPETTGLLKTREVCKLFGVYESTVRKWELDGKIKAIKTPSGHRRFDKQSVLAYLADDKKVSVPKEPTKKNFLYCRVSSKHQENDLDRQSQFLKSKYSDYQLVTDIGSGLNWKRKGLRTILDTALAGNLGEVVVSYRDRLARFGFEIIEYIITKQGGTLTVLDQENTKSSNNELAEDLLSIVAVFNARQMGRRRYSQKSQKSENTNQSNQSSSYEDTS